MDNKHCPNCGKALTDEALQGLCPECLMKAGWPTAPSADGQGHDFTPPELNELAALFPQLEILEKIGKGGMGAVYKARQPELDRLVALKILIPKDPNDPGFAERFTREARALARLSHPNIVAVYDFGHIEELHYFIMEFVDGPNLRDIEKAGEMSPREALQIIPQICVALQFAHDEGIVHRDIKPENILLNRKGRVKIADFGLAKILGHEAHDLHLTLPGHVMGTPHYMAPEQVEHPQDVDHRADIYSLGVVFYEMLTGELPLGKFAPPSRKVQIDVRLDEVVLRTLAKEPELRYQQVSQVQTEVRTIVSTSQVSKDNSEANEDPLLSLDDFHRIQKRLRWPSIGLFLSGLIYFIYSLLKLIDVISQGPATLPYEQWAFYSNLIMSAYAIGVAIGAIYMHQLCHYVSTLLIAIFSGNLFGLWALVILCHKETRKAFQQNKTQKIIPRLSIHTISRSIGNGIGRMLCWARNHSILLALSLGILCFIGVVILMIQSGLKHEQHQKEQQKTIKRVFAEAVYEHLNPYHYYAAINEISLSPDLQHVEMKLSDINLFFPRNDASFRDQTPISRYFGDGKWRIHFYDEIIVPDLIVDTSKEMKQGPVGIPPAPLPSPFDTVGLPYPQLKVVRAWDGVECLFPDPLAALQAWRQTKEYQAWRKVKNVTNFTYQNGMGYQFTLFVQAWQAGGPELLGGIELNRPDGTLLAKAVTFMDAESDYEILVYNETGDQAIARIKVAQVHTSDELVKHISEVQWGARGGVIEKTTVNEKAGTTHISKTWQWDRNGRYWLVNDYGVAYQEAFRTDERHEEKIHLLPQLKDTLYTESVTNQRVINGQPYWGPTNELTLKCNPNLSHSYADLTAGEVLSASPEALQRLLESGRQPNRVSLSTVVDACPSDSVDLLIWDDEFYILNPCMQRMAFELSFDDCSAPYFKLVQEKTLNPNQEREENELPLSSEPMCLMIITRQERLGLLEIQEYNKERRERKLRFKLLESDDPNCTVFIPQSIESVPQQHEEKDKDVIIERELHASGLFDNDLFDFRSNTVFAFPDKVKFWDVPQWMAERGIDVVCVNFDNGLVLTGNGKIMGFGGNICKFIPTNSQMNCSREDLLEQWSQIESQDITDYQGWDYLPQRFFFKSRNQDQGILEIMDTNDAAQSIHIRYRLFSTVEETMSED